MISDINIWRCASVMIKRYGDLADVEAAARADEYEKRGERGQRVWLRIMRAIDALQKVQAGETKH